VQRCGARTCGLRATESARRRRARACESGLKASVSIVVVRLVSARSGGAWRAAHGRRGLLGTRSAPGPRSAAAPAASAPGPRLYTFTTPLSAPAANRRPLGAAASAVAVRQPSSTSRRRQVRVRMSHVCTTPSPPAPRGARRLASQAPGWQGGRRQSCKSLPHLLSHADGTSWPHRPAKRKARQPPAADMPGSLEGQYDMQLTAKKELCRAEERSQQGTGADARLRSAAARRRR